MAKGRPRKVLMGAEKNIPNIEEESIGLGDTLEKRFKALGIDKLVKFIAGEDCGCEERKAKLNALFPYKKPLCLTEEEHIYLTDFFERGDIRIIPTVQRQLLKIYNRVFSERSEPTTCASCLKGILNKLEKVNEQYKDI